MRTVLFQLEMRARSTLGDESLADFWPGILERAGPGGALQGVLARWAAADPKPLVLLIDEIDALVGDSLLSVLRQLRSGYDQRPEGFPQSVVLCGVRDVRDYRIHSSSGKRGHRRRQRVQHQGPVAASGRLLAERGAGAARAAHGGDRAGVRSGGAGGGVGALPGGQPWLVNALADEACFRNRGGRDPRPLGERAGHHRGAGAAHRAPGDAPGPACRQAPGGPGAARRRTDAERRRGAELLGPRHRVRARPGAGGAARTVAHRQPRSMRRWCRAS